MKQTFKQFLLESEQKEKFSDYDKWLARCKKLNLKIDQSRDSHLYIANHCSTKSGVWVGSFDQAQSNSPGKGEILISKINDSADENKQLRDLKKDFKNNPNDYVATDSFGNFYDEIKKFKAKTKQLKSASGNLPEIAIKDGKIIGFMDSKRKGFVKLKEALQESAPPDMEDWVKENKARFKKEYGDEWEQALYATAWKIHNQKKKNLKEDLDDLEPFVYFAFNKLKSKFPKILFDLEDDFEYKMDSAYLQDLSAWELANSFSSEKKKFFKNGKLDLVKAEKEILSKIDFVIDNSDLSSNIKKAIPVIAKAWAKKAIPHIEKYVKEFLEESIVLNKNCLSKK